MSRCVARPLSAIFALVFFACEAPPDTALDAGAALDAGSDAPSTCALDTQCDDALHCNGRERCAPAEPAADARGCVAGDAPDCGGMGCNEDEDRCAEDCDTEADADDDGHRATACGGDDCDDGDPLRHPGATEICDAGDRDEDCDPTTFGFRDADGDTYPDARCCNVSAEGERACGSDCDDARPSSHASSVEACDRADNDCDGEIDEGVLRTFFVDADGDGRGDPAQPTVEACFVPAGHAEVAGDCDDTNAAVRTGAPEVCDAAGLDEDCDGTANPDALCTCSGADARACARPGACAAGTERCAEGAWGACSISPVLEVCNTIDDDCDGSVDEMLLVECFLDADDDGWAASGATSARLCPVGGRASVGGCHIGFTNRAPLDPALDCDEDADTTHPTAREICNAVDDDCDGSVDEGLMLVERYVDRDGDGAEGEPVMRCEGDPGSVAVSRDCNESRADVYRGAPELCDRLDNNCSLGGAAAGGVDAYEDEDDDGYAPMGALCSGGPRPRTDCNDDPDAGGAADHPGAAEVCSGRDTDCDGRVDEDPDADASCSAAGARAGCAGDGTCRVFACDAGRGDCNGSYADGCEVDLTTSSAHCGGCGLACGAGATCVAGLCERVDALATGDYHTCVRFSGGAMGCAGENGDGELGDGTRSDRTTFVPVTGLSGVARIALGFDHSCVLLSSGALRCWGSNHLGRVGDGTTGGTRLAPVDVVGLAGPVVEIAAGFDSTCARLADGRVQCWGGNASGQLGDGTTTSRASPVTVAGVTDAVAIAVDSRHACAVLADGTARCWGANDYGSLGDGTTTSSSVPVTVSGLSGAASIGLGTHYGCARRADGTVACWGRARWIGDGSTNDAVRTATTVPGLSGALSLSVGNAHACALRADRTIACWGENAYGQLGDATTTAAPTPRAVPGQTDVLEVHAGHRHTCARREGERIACWGENLEGQLVSGSTLASSTPVEIPGLRRVAEVAGYQTFACARRTTGSVACWGDNGYGQLASGTTTGATTRPASAPGLTAISIDAGAELGCAIEPSGQLVCWGRLASGATGVPQPVAGIDDARLVRAAYSHQCVVRATGELWCWGTNGNGELGIGTTSTSESAPVRVSGVSEVHRAALGRGHSCALQRDGRLYCWGANSFGQIGLGTTGGTYRAPQRVVFFDDVVDVAAGNNFTCALRAEGTLACWGMLRVGDVVSAHPTPVEVRALPGERVLAIDAADGGSICALLQSGRLFCWGSENASGQMGTGTQVPIGAPTQVVLHADFSSVMTAPAFTCGARDQRRGLACWGIGGRLGDGTTTSSSVPVSVVDFP